VPPAKPSPLRRAQVLGQAAVEEEPERPRLSPRAAARRRQELLRAERDLRLRQVAEARARAARSDAAVRVAAVPAPVRVAGRRVEPVRFF
jgi:hypothetical protein